MRDQPDSPARPWVVLKFGGTSVASKARWTVIRDQIRARLAASDRPVVVCSAVAGISDALDALPALALAAGAEDPDRALAEHIELIEGRHLTHADQLGVDRAVITDDLRALRRLATGVALVGETSPQVHARIMAFGEILSTRLGAAWLRGEGLDAVWVDARTCLTALPDPTRDPARAFLSASCDDAHDPTLGERFAAAGQAIITQGFIAADEDGRTVLLGRGGSDTAAALFAARLGAKRCEIWTDVPGMFTADPRRIPDARLLQKLDYDEAQEIASTGAKVLHPRCLAPVRRHNIPMQIRWTERPDVHGTTIRHRRDDKPRVRAISTRRGQMLVSMDTPGMWQQVGFLADVFAVFKHHGLSVDLVSTSEMNVTVSLDPASNVLDRARLDALRRDLGRHCAVNLIGPCATISLVGRRIRAILHRLGPALAVFEEQKVHLVSQAASDLNFSVVVDEDQCERLVRSLHWLLFQELAHDPAFGPPWSSLAEVDKPAAPAPQHRPWWHDARDALLAEAARGTPAYVYHAPTLDAAAERLCALEHVDRVFYAIKANPHPDILRRFDARGLGFECVSPQEIEHVFTTLPHITPDRVLYTPNFAPREEYAHGLDRGVWVTLDNLHPLDAWPELFADRDVMVRLDPGKGRGHHDHVKTAGARSKFGVSFEQLDRLAERVAAVGCRVVGLHAHAGSGIRTPEQWAEIAETLAIAAERFDTVRHLDLGGGLSVAEKPGEPGIDLAAVDAHLAAFKERHPQYALWVEPGRYLVADAGVLLTRVTQLKSKGPVRYVGVDAGMNSLIRPALYGAWHAILHLDRLDAPPTLIANVVGPICESGDTLGYNRRLPETAEGDTLLIATTGAYGRAMASHYNLRPPAREVLLG